jgi:hypothetical protein
LTDTPDPILIKVVSDAIYYFITLQQNGDKKLKINMAVKKLCNSENFNTAPGTCSISYPSSVNV